MMVSSSLDSILDSSNENNASVPNGRLSIRVIEARNLIYARHPYCVVQFDKCEFISKEPIQITAFNHGPPNQQQIDFDQVFISPVWKHEASL